MIYSSVTLDPTVIHDFQIILNQKMLANSMWSEFRCIIIIVAVHLKMCLATQTAVICRVSVGGLNVIYYVTSLPLRHALCFVGGMGNGQFVVWLCRYALLIHLMIMVDHSIVTRSHDHSPGWAGVVWARDYWKVGGTYSAPPLFLLVSYPDPPPGGRVWVPGGRVWVPGGRVWVRDYVSSTLRVRYARSAKGHRLQLVRNDVIVLASITKTT